jgi:hypothetical protein
MPGMYLAELGADCCPEVRELSAIRSLESRMAFSNLMTCLSCIHMKSGVSATKAAKPQANR